MKNKRVCLLLLLFIIPLAIAQISDEESITITITSDVKAKVSHLLFPDSFVSSVDVNLISNQISRVLAVDEDNILLSSTQDEGFLNLATLGASQVDLTYNANIITHESGIFKINYQSDEQTKVILPPLSKLVSLNSIPIEVNEREFVLPPGKISLSYNIRQVTSQEFVVSQQGNEHSIEFITGVKIYDLLLDKNEIRFLIKDKAIILGIIPTSLFSDVKDVSLNGEKVDFQKFYQNSTHSWVRIDPHENGLVKIYNEQGQEIEVGGCLIATATFGSELAPQVQQLRELRDNTILNTFSGTSFMTSFNQIYYSFSPTIADIERQNPLFKEAVKIAISPMLSSLSILNYVNIDSEQEMLGYGIGIIFMNIGMYFIAPIFLIYKIYSFRALDRRHSNQLVISINNVKSLLKYSLFGILVLSVLLISVNSAFAQESPPADLEPTPLEIILQMTMDQALEALGDDAPPSAEELYQLGLEAMNTALTLENDDPEAAEDYAIVAMALFEDTTTIIGTPGFGEAFDSASEQGLENGQGLGVGGIPPGIMKQLNVATIFAVSEDINDSEGEVEGLKSLILDNNFNVDLSDYDNAINLAKIALANGEIPNAQEKLAIANELLDEIYDQMNQQAIASEDERVVEFVEKTIQEIESLLENGNKIGLTQNTINELLTTLEILKSGDVDLILDATSEESNFAKELKQENKEAEKEQKSENKDDEKELRDENKEAEKELKESDPEASKQLKVDNKEAEKELKSENKDDEKALRDENKEAEKELKGILKLIGYSFSFSSFDDEWFEEPTDGDYDELTSDPTDKELKKYLKLLKKDQKAADKDDKKDQKAADKDDKKECFNSKGKPVKCK